MFRRCQQDRIDTWYREAAKGKARYILLRGVLGWGLPMFIIMTFVFPAMNGSADDPYNVSRLLRGLGCWRCCIRLVALVLRCEEIRSNPARRREQSG